MNKQPDHLGDLIAANRVFLTAAIAESKDKSLPTDTDVDEYIDMLAAYPRSVRRGLKGSVAGMVDVCRAIKAAQGTVASEHPPVVAPARFMEIETTELNTVAKKFVGLMNQRDYEMAFNVDVIDCLKAALKTIGYEVKP